MNKPKLPAPKTHFISKFYCINKNKLLLKSPKKLNPFYNKVSPIIKTNFSHNLKNYNFCEKFETKGCFP